jgi:UDP-2,4-diacetamido-2,4,6-trideoxy-beta-L-altropyranose hydrolase
VRETHIKSVAFRVDASIEIGAGHVMRCLALASALRQRGISSHFLCRAQSGDLIDQIRQLGFEVALVPQVGADASADAAAPELGSPDHAAWLGARWQDDAQETRALLRSAGPGWLIVDHYALDARWEREIRDCCPRLMVIDDLADRPHECDVLLDQSFDREAADYDRLLPPSCERLTGSRYALLRSEFMLLRPYSLSRRGRNGVNVIVIAMGGVDRANASGRVLAALCDGGLPGDIVINVAMGPRAPWVDQVRAVAAATAPRQVNVLTDVRDMARLLADSDLAIGAAGGSALERCCLGVPSVLLALADNQREAAETLAAHGAAIYVGDEALGPERAAAATQALLSDVEGLMRLSRKSARLCDGGGADRAAETVCAAIVERRPVFRAS